MTVREYKEKLLTDAKFREEQGICMVCGQNVKDRIITIYESLIDELYQVYKWCGEHKRHEFSMKDIRHLLSKNGYNRFNDLVKCSGGIVYRPEGDDDETHKGSYGMNMARAKAFFKGEREMPMQVRLNQLTKEKEILKTAKVGDFPALTNLLNTQGLYDHERLL